MARVLVVDDTLAGIRAARNAGCWAVGVVESGNEFGLSAESLAALPAAERAERYAVAEARLREAGAHEVIASVASLLPVLEGFEARLALGERP
jgi:phosphonoacetaldehyde hydrolase